MDKAPEEFALPSGEIIKLSPDTPPLETVAHPVKDRITVVEMVYHQHTGDNPTQTTSTFCRELETDEQPYGRDRKIGEEWEPLCDKHCWLENASLIVVQNKEGSFPIVNPTEEERAASLAKVLEIRQKQDSDPFCYIPNLESVRFSPYDITSLEIRCKKGIAKSAITIFPH